MLRFFHALMPREDRFIPRFSEHADRIVAASGALRGMIAGEGGALEHLQSILRSEREADEITRSVYQAIHETFITPFDRDDISRLINGLDDVVDLIEDAARQIVRYQVRDFTPQMLAVADCILRCAGLVKDMMPCLAAVTRNAARLTLSCQQIGQIEGEADEVHDAALAALHRAARDPATGLDPIGYADRKEIYESLEAVVDRFDDVANVISGIVIEQV